ncbi:MAG: TonB-dependent receptor plug domain-containing protein [Candidatus Cloacimonetes bacterium]|nr:TonB-dependent receptor plug domain-containing protein [Candidatus Cloacimonadota bacterium]
MRITSIFRIVRTKDDDSRQSVLLRLDVPFESKLNAFRDYVIRSLRRFIGGKISVSNYSQSFSSKNRSISNIRYSILMLLSIFLLGFSGKVIDENDQPIENVIITNGKTAVVSSQNGNFQIEIIEGEIRFHKIGFADLVFLNPDEIPDKIMMTIEVIELEGIDVVERRIDLKFPDVADKIVIEVDNESGDSAAEILQRNSIVRISGIDLAGERRTVSLSGHKSKHTLILLDGIPLTSSGEDFDLASIPTEIIRSIEIVTNNAQTGSGSLAGIININTKNADGKFSLDIGQKFGSFGMQKTKLTISIANNFFNSYFYAAQSITDNDYKFETGNNLKNNENLQQDFSGNIDLNFLPVEVEYRLDHQKYAKSYLTPENINIYDNSTSEGYINRQKLHFQKDFQNFQTSANLYYFREKSEYDNSESVWLPILNKHLKRLKGADAKCGFETKQIDFELGMTLREEQIDFENQTNPVANISQKRKNYAGFGSVNLTQDIFPFALNVLFSNRAEKYENLDGFYTYKLDSNLKYESFLTIILGGNYGTGFTVPSFYDLYWNDGQAHGNADLLSETAEGFQVYGKVKWERNHLKIAYNSNKIRNLIHWSRQTDYWLPQNIETVEISNMEIDTKVYLQKYFTIGTSYQKTLARNKTGNLYNKFLTYTPQYIFKGFLEFTNGGFSGTIDFSQTGKQYTTPDQLSEELVMPEYKLMNAEFTYKKEMENYTFQVGTKVNNLLDKDYELYKYMPQPGRNWQVNFGVSYKI